MKSSARLAKPPGVWHFKTQNFLWFGVIKQNVSRFDIIRQSLFDAAFLDNELFRA